MNDFTSGACNLGFVKEEEQIQRLHRLAKDHFETLQVFFLEMMVRSSRYPTIQFPDLLAAFLEAQEHLKEPDALQRAVLELQYVTTSRGQKETGLRATLNRAGLLEMLLRCALQNYGKDLLSRLPEFLEAYLAPTVRQSTIIPIRKLIRRNRILNDYLVDN